MGAFVLGILVGWLLEWLFFTYWIKGRSTGKFADCSGLKLELTAKNKEISDLKADLVSASATDEKVLTVESAEKKPVDSTKTSSVKASSATNNKDQKSVKPSAPSSKPSTATKNETLKKSATQKTTATKKSPPKASPKKAKSTSKIATVKKTNKSTGDDFTKLSGIGPSISAKLNELGISTFQKLSEMDDDILRDMLEESGARMNNNKEAMDTWNEQAALAAKGDFEGLKKFQKSLKS